MWPISKKNDWQVVYDEKNLYLNSNHLKMHLLLNSDKRKTQQRGNR